MIPRIAIGTITYNDREGLAKLIESTFGKVYVHFIVEGKFPNHPGTEKISTDGTIDLIQAYQKKKGEFIHYSICLEDEFTKRQKYLQLCEFHRVDALLILDSDEYIDDEKTTWELFYKEVLAELYSPQNVYGIIGYWGTENEKPRLWIRPHEMTYVNGSHRIFKNKFHDQFLDIDGCMYMKEGVIKSLRFIQDSSYRTEERKQAHDEYYKWLINHESELKNKHLL